MILHKDGSYETGAWHTPETYPDSYFIDENTETGKVLAAKLVQFYPYVKVTISIAGEVTDVQQREKTPEEIEEENKPQPKERIDIVEDEAAALALEPMETQIRLENSQAEHAALILALVEKGSL